MKKLVIIGAGGQGKVCANIAKDMKVWNEIVFLDDSFPRIKKCLDFDIIDTPECINSYLNCDFFVSIGNNDTRKKFIDLLTKKKVNIVTLIHPTASVSCYSTIGKGTSIHQNSVVNTDTVIGKGCIINTGVIVEHENIIKNFTHLSPNVTLGGQVTIGENVWIGIGTTIINNVSITDRTMIGAHSLVLSTIDISGVYKGLIK